MGESVMAVSMPELKRAKVVSFPVDRLNQTGPTIYTVSMDDRYHVTSDGDVIGLSGQILKGWLVNGYKFVKIGKRSVLVHRLVAMAFIWQPPGCDQAHHVDHDKSNNGASNLMWVTGAQNAAYAKEAGRYQGRDVALGTNHGQALLDDAKVHQIRSSDESNADLARRFKVSVTTVRLARIGRTWRHV